MLGQEGEGTAAIITTTKVFCGCPREVWESSFPAGNSFLLRGTEKKTQTLKWSGTKKLARFFGLGNRSTPFWSNFGGWTGKRTSPSTSWQFFALDAPIMSSVRLKIAKNVSVGALGSALTLLHPPCPAPPLCIWGMLHGAKIFEIQIATHC